MLHYRGDWRKFVPNRIVGPDMDGGWWKPKSAVLINAVTTIWYTPVPWDQLPPKAKRESERVRAKRIRIKDWKVYF